MPENTNTIYYKDQQIEKQKVLDKLADGFQDFISENTWSSSKKEKVVDAYSDLVNRGILGVGNENGIYEVEINGTIDLDGMSKSKRDAYEKAASYIIKQVRGIDEFAKAEEKKKKEGQKKLTNSQFIDDINKSISKTYFGGMSDYDMTTGWNKMDKYGETSKRATALADILRKYRDNFDPEKYDFEDSPFDNADDLKARLDDAIKALQTGSDEDKTRYLYRLGINPERYLAIIQDPAVKAAAEAAGNQTGQTGQTGETSETSETSESNESSKQTEQNKPIVTKPYTKPRGKHIYVYQLWNPSDDLEASLATYGKGEDGFNAVNKAVPDLLEKIISNNPNTTDSDRQRLSDAITYVLRNNPAYIGIGGNISDEEYKILADNLRRTTKFKNLASKKNDYVKLPWKAYGQNVYYHKPTRRLIQADAINKNFGATNPTSTGFNPYYKKDANFRKEMMNEYKRKFLMKGSEAVDLKDQDIDITIAEAGSMAATFASLKGGKIGIIAALTALVGDTYVDARQGNFSLGNLISNAGLAGAALFDRKSAIAKLANKLGKYIITFNTIEGVGDVKDIYNRKLSKGDFNLSADDFTKLERFFRNVVVGAHAIKNTGSWVNKGTARKTIESKTTPGKVAIKTTKGVKVVNEEIRNNYVKTLNKKGKKAADDQFKEATKSNDEVPIVTASQRVQESGRAWYNPVRYMRAKLDRVQNRGYRRNKNGKWYKPSGWVIANEGYIGRDVPYKLVLNTDPSTFSPTPFNWRKSWSVGGEGQGYGYLERHGYYDAPDVTPTTPKSSSTPKALPAPKPKLTLPTTLIPKTGTITGSVNGKNYKAKLTRNEDGTFNLKFDRVGRSGKILETQEFKRMNADNIMQNQKKIIDNIINNSKGKISRKHKFFKDLKEANRYKKGGRLI